MTLTENQKEAAKSCFDYDSTLEKVFVTSDNQCFTKLDLAQLHVNGAKLEDKTIFPVGRDLESEVAAEPPLIPEEEKTEETPTEEKKEAAAEGSTESDTPAQVIDKKLKAMSKVELAARATEIGLEFTEDNTKAELIALIEG